MQDPDLAENQAQALALNAFDEFNRKQTLNRPQDRYWYGANAGQTYLVLVPVLALLAVPQS